MVVLQNIIASDESYINACLLEDASVICVNKKTNINKSMAFKLLYEHNKKFWFHNKTWEYYITGDEFKILNERISKMKEKLIKLPIITNLAISKSEKEVIHENYGKQYESIITMSDAERVQRIQEDKLRLDALIAQYPRKKQIIAEALIETAQNAVLYNHAALVNAINLSSDDARKQTNELVDSTYSLIKSSSQLISENILNDELINTLVSKSNGTIIQHITRVYLKGLSFLAYYNRLVSASSIVNKLRAYFKDRYLFFYHSILPHLDIDVITLERVFLGGMRAIPENTFYDWAVGFLIHDIGKGAAVDYHEGGAAYNRDTVIEHVKVGYNSIITKTNYPRDAGLIAGYHHEYYGDKSGYGLFRSTFEQYKKNHPNAQFNYCITYDIKHILNCDALGFFPVKVLEIIDVYDALTDPNRKYHKALNAKEALATMKEEFIDAHCKIDIILFDLFSDYIQETMSS